MAAWVDGWADGWSDGAEWIRLRTTAAGLAERSSAGWAACLDKVTRTSWFLLWEQGRVELYSVFSWFYSASSVLPCFLCFFLSFLCIRTPLPGSSGLKQQQGIFTVNPKTPRCSSCDRCLDGFPSLQTRLVLKAWHNCSCPLKLQQQL